MTSYTSIAESSSTLSRRHHGTGLASGVYVSPTIAYSAETMKAPNSYLFALIDPMGVPIDEVGCPDTKLNVRMPKRVTYNATIKPSDLDPVDPPVTLMVVFKPMNQTTGPIGGQIQLWGKRPLDQRWKYYSSILPDQDLGSSFKFIRYVSGGVNFLSDTISAGTFAVAGTVVSIWTKDPPRFDEVDPSTLPSYRQCSEDVVVNTRLSEGVMIVGGPSGDDDWFQPESNSIFSSGKSQYSANYYYQQNQSGGGVPATTRPNSAGWDFTDAFLFDSDRVGAEIIYGMTGLTTISLNVSGVHNAVSPEDLFLRCGIVYTYSEGGVDVDAVMAIPGMTQRDTNTVSAIRYQCTANGDVNIVTPSPITRIRVFFLIGPAVGASVPMGDPGSTAYSAFNIATMKVVNDNVATIGQESGVGIATITGMASDQSIAFEGTINYEAIPNAELSRNVKMSSAGASLNLADLHTAREILSHKGLAGIRGVYPRQQYLNMIRSGYFQQLAMRYVHVGLASDWRRGLKTIFRHAGRGLKQAGRLAYREAQPLLHEALRAGVQAGTQSLLSYAQDAEEKEPAYMVGFAADTKVKTSFVADIEPALELPIDAAVFSPGDERHKVFKTLASRIGREIQQRYDQAEFGYPIDSASFFHDATSRVLTTAAIIATANIPFPCNCEPTMLHHVYHIDKKALSDPRVSLTRFFSSEKPLPCGYQARSFQSPCSDYDKLRTMKEFQKATLQTKITTGYAMDAVERGGEIPGAASERVMEESIALFREVANKPEEKSFSFVEDNEFFPRGLYPIQYSAFTSTYHSISNNTTRAAATLSRFPARLATFAVAYMQESKYRAGPVTLAVSNAPFKSRYNYQPIEHSRTRTSTPLTPSTAQMSYVSVGGYHFDDILSRDTLGSSAEMMDMLLCKKGLFVTILNASLQQIQGHSYQAALAAAVMVVPNNSVITGVYDQARSIAVDTVVFGPAGMLKVKMEAAQLFRSFCKENGLSAPVPFFVGGGVSTQHADVVTINPFHVRKFGIADLFLPKACGLAPTVDSLIAQMCQVAEASTQTRVARSKAEPDPPDGSSQAFQQLLLIPPSKREQVIRRMAHPTQVEGLITSITKDASKWRNVAVGMLQYQTGLKKKSETKTQIPNPQKPPPAVISNQKKQEKLKGSSLHNALSRLRSKRGLLPRPLLDSYNTAYENALAKKATMKDVNRIMNVMTYLDKETKKKSQPAQSKKKKKTAVIDLNTLDLGVDLVPVEPFPEAEEDEDDDDGSDGGTGEDLPTGDF